MKRCSGTWPRCDCSECFDLYVAPPRVVLALRLLLALGPLMLLGAALWAETSSGPA